MNESRYVSSLVVKTFKYVSYKEIVCFVLLSKPVFSMCYFSVDVLIKSFKLILTILSSFAIVALYQLLTLAPHLLKLFEKFTFFIIIMHTSYLRFLYTLIAKIFHCFYFSERYNHIFIDSKVYIFCKNNKLISLCVIVVEYSYTNILVKWTVVN